MKEFVPDYTNIINAAYNKEAKRLPLYEHVFSDHIMEQILNKEFAGLIKGNLADKKEYFRNYCGFFKKMGYDTVCYECGMAPVLMPDGGALTQHKPGAIKNRQDFDSFL